jgi:hypothetical protein
VGTEHGLKTVGWKDYQELEDERLARLDESIFECAHFLADLMAIDGALVLTAAWDVIGFGAEIHGPSNRNEALYRALDLEAMEPVEERADEAGTRHRAAYRLSRQHPECMIIVVSQDGAARYVDNLDGKVTYWELGPFKRRARGLNYQFAPRLPTPDREFVGSGAAQTAPNSLRSRQQIVFDTLRQGATKRFPLPCNE